MSTAFFALLFSSFAYINGGDYYTTLTKFENELNDAGWQATFGQLITNEDIRAVVDRDRAEHVNGIAGRAFKAFPEKLAGKLTPEVKREIIRQARAAIDEGLEAKKSVGRKGTVGEIEYRVGLETFSSYYQTSERGKKLKHPHVNNGLAPYIALRLKKAE